MEKKTEGKLTEEIEAGHARRMGGRDWMNHQGTKHIETERLVLRRLSMDDAENMFNNWASDFDVTRYLTWPAHESPDATREILGTWSKEYEKDNYYHWGIELKEISQVIGAIAVVSMREDIKMAHVGYCIGKRWWHLGIMTEAFGAVIEFLFNEVGFNRVESRHDVNNPHSGEVMKKCGLKYEGTLRQADWNNQGVCDVMHYGILKEDYMSSDGK